MTGEINVSQTHPQVRLRRGAERLLIKGHPWVFSGAVTRRTDDCEPGCIVDVLNDAGRFIARGYFNPHSEIAVRILTRQQDEVIDREFLRRRMEQAIRLRVENPLLMEVSSARRLIHGESDGLPGLIVDDYAGWLVMQIHTMGMEKLRPLIVETLQDVIDSKGIWERSDVGTRRADGLKDRPTGLVSGAEPPELVEFHEAGVPMTADLRNGQKTGFFLDQRENRILLGRISRDASVLNCFSYTGGFSVHARHGGARRTLDVDVVPAVLQRGRKQAVTCADETRSAYAAADGFRFLDMLAERANRPMFDVVVIDPPSLVRKGRDVKNALGVYTNLNRNALRLVRDGGYLLTASCSTRVSEDDFFQVVRRAAPGARVTARLLHANGHPADHPIDPAFPEGRYLKSLLLRVFRT